MELLVLLYAVNFVRTLLIIAIIYFGIRIIRKYVLPMLIDQGVKNMQQKMQDQQRQQQRSQRQEGEVTIENNQNNPRNSSSNKGEYVDFEEVE